MYNESVDVMWFISIWKDVEQVKFIDTYGWDFETLFTSAWPWHSNLSSLYFYLIFLFYFLPVTNIIIIIFFFQCTIIEEEDGFYVCELISDYLIAVVKESKELKLQFNKQTFFSLLFN